MRSPVTRRDPYLLGDPTDSPVYLLQTRSVAMAESATGLEWDEDHECLRDPDALCRCSPDQDGVIDADACECGLMGDEALIEAGHAIEVWTTQWVVFTREEGERWRGEEGSPRWKTRRVYGVPCRGDLRLLVRAHTEGMEVSRG